MYMRLIVDVHKMVFDADGRNQQLEELRRLTTILWDSVSDDCHWYADKTTTMFNPSFQTMVNGGLHHLRSTVDVCVDFESTHAAPSAAYLPTALTYSTGTPPLLACMYA
jgi:hypothetical protein